MKSNWKCASLIISFDFHSISIYLSDSQLKPFRGIDHLYFKFSHFKKPVVVNMNQLLTENAKWRFHTKQKHSIFRCKRLLFCPIVSVFESIFLEKGVLKKSGSISLMIYMRNWKSRQEKRLRYE